MSNAVVALLSAAGQGTRLGYGTPKALVKIAGRSIIYRAVAAFRKIPEIKEIFVAIPPGAKREFQDALADFSGVTLVDGGETRQESVSLGLEEIARRLAYAAADPFVLIHDAARCFIEPETIQKTIDALKSHRAVTVALPVVDTLKRVDTEGRVVEAVSRDALWGVQTPQGFRLSDILAAHFNAKLTQRAVTDDTSLVEGHFAVHVVAGSRTNFKVTTPEDIAMAERIAASEK